MSTTSTTDNHTHDHESTSFFLTPRGTIVTVLAVIALYILITISPAFGIGFAHPGQQCAGQDGLVCTAAGRRIARMAPVTGTTVGFLIAIIGCFLPPLRHRRPLWLFLAIVMTAIGFMTAAVVSNTAP